MATSRAATPDLPGFTYDVERGRYMRTLADHHARALGDAAKAASASIVKDISAYEERRRNEEEHKAFTSRLRIQRSRIHRKAVIGMSLDREIGLRKNLSDARGDVWTQFIEPEWFAPVYYASSWCMMKKTMQDHAFIGVSRYSGASPLVTFNLKVMFNDSPCDFSKQYSLEASFSQVSSINLTEKYAFLTTFHRNEQNRLIEIPRSTERSKIPQTSYSVSKANNQHDYWCTSFHPDISKPQIAVGSEHSILVQNPFCSHGHGLSEYKRPATSSPALSIQWKSENVIAAGLRDKTVHLYDVRARDNVFRLRHSQAVMRLHCPDENKLLLGGPKQLSMYDLRYNKSPHRQRESRPWLHYRSYDNTRWNGYDMDVSARLGLLALALEGTTEIWNLWTGTKLRELPRSFHSVKPKVVMFTRPNHRPHFFKEEDDPTGLLVCAGESAVEWQLDGEDVDGSEHMAIDHAAAQCL